MTQWLVQIVLSPRQPRQDAQLSLQFAIHLFNIYLIIFLIMSYPCGKCYRLFHQQEKHKFALSLISLVGISISVAALALAFLTFAFLR